MKTSFKLLDTDCMQATMSITLNLGEWKNLRDTLTGARTFRENQVGYAIRDMVQTAEATFQKEYSNDTDSF